MSANLLSLLMLVVTNFFINLRNGNEVFALRSNKNIENRNQSRSKRNVGQLGFLVEKYTAYTAKQMLEHGNYCGPGGNRARDGSIRDACDNCCKIHDNCYDQLLRYSNENLNLNIFNRQSRNDIKSFLPFLFDGISNGVSRPCVPYVDSYQFTENRFTPYCDNRQNACALKACNCDMQFVYCLRKAQRCRVN